MYPGERFNSITHLVGACLAFAGLVVLVVWAALYGDARRVVSFSIYGGTLLLLYTFSTLYHSFRGTAKRIFRYFDHGAIYLLIAGTYTPFALVGIRGRLGWSILTVVWSLAVAGILLEFRQRKGRRILAVVIYVTMGWLGVVAIRPLEAALGPAGLAWLLAGGVFYTTGIAFYATDKRLPIGHGIWHLFVLAGSVAHYLAILLYLRR
ncbi:MAG: hemolysin III family protein [Acidobacteria bacterium]|nr:MAG: hemolysin III family protein [Acidobacteriota bacterium]